MTSSKKRKAPKAKVATPTSSCESEKPRNKKTRNKQKDEAKKTTKHIQAHKVDWTSREGATNALLPNGNVFNEEELDDYSCKEIVLRLFNHCLPKQLSQAFACCCIKINKNMDHIEMDDSFSHRSVAQETFLNVLLSICCANQEETEDKQVR